MKIILFSATLVWLAFSACSNNDNKPGQANQPGDQSASTTETSNSSGEAVPIGGIVSGYLQIKNALANDNSKEAADAGKEMVEAITRIDNSSFTENQKKIFAEVQEDAREHAEHIGSNAGDIKHQREHFETLSKDVYDLVRSFPTERTFYYVFCPMYNDSQGGYWISEVKEIKNPYMGKEMPNCGEIKEEIK